MTSDSTLEREMLLRASSAEAPSWLAGRGIVTCAGGVRMFTNVYVLVRLLRETLGCRLPIEVWSYGATELTAIMRHLLRQYEVDLIDAPAILQAYPSPISTGWQLKSYAVLHSRFRDVLYLDADQVPVVDPQPLFDSDEFNAAGAVFWPDSVDLRADNPIWAELGLAAADTPSWESGQMLVDTARHWKALSAAHFLNENHRRVSEMIYGDKDTYLAAWRRLGAACAVVPHRPYRDARVLIQRDFSGSPLFQHRANAKWIYGGRQYDFEGSVHMRDCLRFLDELRERWNGRVFFPPDRPLAARQEESRLAGASAVLEIIGDHTVDIDLLPCHEFGRGRNFDRQNWHVEGEDLSLIFSDGTRPTYRLRKVGPRAWEGAAEGAIGPKVLLTEQVGEETGGMLPGHGLVASIVEASGLRNAALETDPSARGELISALRLLLRGEPGLRPAVEAVLRETVAAADIASCVLDGETDRTDFAPVRNDGILARNYKERPLRP